MLRVKYKILSGLADMLGVLRIHMQRAIPQKASGFLAPRRRISRPPRGRHGGKIDGEDHHQQSGGRNPTRPGTVFFVPCNDGGMRFG